MSTTPSSSSASGLLPEQAVPSVQVIPLRFTGSGSEYFRIWIVNSLLLVLTLAVQAGRWHSDGWWSQSYAGPRLQQVLAYALPYGGGLGDAAGWDWQRWVPGPS